MKLTVKTLKKMIEEGLSENHEQAEYDAAKAADPIGGGLERMDLEMMGQVASWHTIRAMSHSVKQSLRMEVEPDLNFLQPAIAAALTGALKEKVAAMAPQASRPYGMAEEVVEEAEEQVPYQGADYFKKKKEKERKKQDVPGDALKPADEPKLKPSGKMSARHRFKHSGSGRSMKRIKETKTMKITQKQLKQMIKEEYDKYVEAWDYQRKGIDTRARDRGNPGITPGDTLVVFSGLAGKHQEFLLQHDEGGTELLYIVRDGKTIFISPEGNSQRIRRLQRQPDGSVVDLLPGMAPVLDPGQEQKLVMVKE